MEDGAQILGLSESDTRTVREVLSAVEGSVVGGVALGGSLAQRALLPDLAHSLSGQRLHDIDLVIPLRSRDAVQPQLRKDFYVTHIEDAGEGYYFGLIHKRSRMWIDLFTPAYEREYVNIELDDKTYRATSIESQVLHLAHDAFWRHKNGREIRAKWIEKLRTLSSASTLSWERIEREYAEQKEHFSGAYTGTALPSARIYIAEALEVPPSSAQPRSLRGFLKRMMYPNAPRTQTGVSIEPPWVWYPLFLGLR